jgi:hypothetical protein
VAPVSFLLSQRTSSQSLNGQVGRVDLLGFLLDGIVARFASYGRVASRAVRSVFETQRMVAFATRLF